MSDRRKDANQIWARRIEYALLACGFMLLAFWGAARVHTIISSRAALRRFAAVDSSAPMSADPIRDHRTNDPLLGSDFSLWDEKRVQAFGKSIIKDFGDPLAVLRIPKIRLEVPVFDGTDSLTLNHALGRISGTARLGERGNLGLAGHRDGFFRGLKDLSIGDTVELQGNNGTEIYTVDQLRIVYPQDVSVLRPKPYPSLTLVTCYPFYFVGSAPKRYIVSASLTQRAGQGVLPAVSTNHFVQFTRRNNEQLQ